MEQKKNYRVVYTIVERERDGKSFWLRVGAAFQNRDGSLNVHLDAMPINGKLQIRDQDYKEKSRSGSANAPLSPVSSAEPQEDSKERRRRLAS